MKNYGTNTDPKSLATMGDLADAHKEAYLEWGGRVIENGLSPIDASCMKDFNANRLLGFPANRVMITHYTDNIVTSFSAYAPDTVHKLFSDAAQIYLGGTKTSQSGRMKTEIVLRLSEGSDEHSVLYCEAKKLLVQVQCGTMTGMRIRVSGKTISNVDDGVEEWEEFSDFAVSGWPVWTSIPLEKTLGAYKDQKQKYKYGELKIEFYSTGDDAGANDAAIKSIRLLAPTMYYASYRIANDNHPYTIDKDGNPVFGGKVSIGSNVWLYINEQGKLFAHDANGYNPVVGSSSGSTGGTVTTAENNHFTIDILDGSLRLNAKTELLERIKSGKCKLRLMRNIVSRHQPVEKTNIGFVKVPTSNLTIRGYTLYPAASVTMVEDNKLNFKIRYEYVSLHNTFNEIRDTVVVNKEDIFADVLYCIGERTVINGDYPQGTTRKSIVWGSRPIAYDTFGFYTLKYALVLTEWDDTIKKEVPVSNIAKFQVIVTREGARFKK